MSLDRLFWRRFFKHQARNARYMRLLFNDHFIIFLVILLGAAIICYRILLGMPASNPFWQTGWWQYGTLAWLLIGLQFGDFVTYVKPADRLFLLGNDRFMVSRYFRQALKVSYGYAILWQLAFIISIAPILTRIGINNVISVGSMIIFIMTYKLLMLMETREKLFLKPRTEPDVIIFERNTVPEELLYHFLYPAVVLGLILFLQPNLSAATLILWLLVLAGVWLFHFRTNHEKWQVYAIDWTPTVRQSQLHEQKILHFYSLFAEVPHLPKSIKRRPYLDWLISWMSGGRSGLYRLYAIRLVRNDEILPLIIRLIAVGIVILLSLSQAPFWLTVVVAAVVIYLINFQILPLYEETQKTLWTRLMPLTAAQRSQSFGRLLLQWSLISAVIISLANLAQPLRALGIFVGSLLMTAFLQWYYVPHALKKVNKGAR
ncbi:ABC transporter permease [Leuconostocaceae bacterium ESL0723]|nr:ABC transporter permease [Leuconostocaceae bacterium ESL0723]